MLLALDRVPGNPDRHLRHVPIIRSTSLNRPVSNHPEITHGAARIESRRRVERSPVRRLTRRAVSFIQRGLAVTHTGRKVLV